MNFPIFVFGCRSADEGQCTFVAHVHLLAAYFNGKVGSVLMHLVHLENVISGSQHHLFPFGQDHRLQYVDNLGYVRHFQAVGVFVEDVERQGSHKGVTHGVLLVEVASDRTGFFVPPCSPFIEHERHVLVFVIFVHNGAVSADHIFYFTTFTHGPIIVILVEPGCRAFAAGPSANGVVVE